MNGNWKFKDCARTAWWTWRLTVKNWDFHRKLAKLSPKNGLKQIKQQRLLTLKFIAMNLQENPKYQELVDYTNIASLKNLEAIEQYLILKG